MPVEYRRPDLSIDRQLALKTAASALARGFDGTFGTETIDRFLHSSYDDPAGLDVDDVRPIRDEIERRVRRLLTELEVPARA